MIRLRDYQQRIVRSAKAALDKRQKALIVAATGAGKTVMLAALAHEVGGRQLVLQHRLELVQQNSRTFRKVNPEAKIGYWTANKRHFGADTTFAMVPSLANHVDRMPKLDLIIADEAHHSIAPTWMKIIEAAYDANPDLKLAGFTATPSRSDGQGLKKLFGEVCDSEPISDLVRKGFLVQPRGFIIDVEHSREKLKKLGNQSDFGEQSGVEDILNNEVVNAEVIRNWRDKAADRQTVVFASTVRHAEDVAAAFRGAGVGAACVSGEMDERERKKVFDALAKGEIQVVTNCMVLTEGWDFPPVSCVILLRRCSSKSPLIQMAGRGLRTVPAEKYPGIVKKDCLILDFGLSLMTAGDLTASLDISDRKGNGEGPKKQCPDCLSMVPMAVKECPNCGHKFGEGEESDDKGELTHVELTEVEILNASPWKYINLFGSGRIEVASGFDAWAGVVTKDDDTWYAIGQKKNSRTVSLVAGSHIQALAAADDFMRMNETGSTAKKTHRWLTDPATDAQKDILSRWQVSTPGSKYDAACYMNFFFHQREIERIIGVRR